MWQKFIVTTIIVAVQLICTTGAYEVIYAINAGGEAYRDTNNIQYERDPLMDKIGIASDYGKQLMIIGRVQEQSDEILYQTERYHTATFGYDMPIKGDGDYVLILKFCEVYFNAPKMKVFDVTLNGEHTVIPDLDIFQQVGKGVAHDEYVYFTISRGKLFFKEEESEVRGNRIRVEFIKGYRDNPKVNAIVLIKGDAAGDIDTIPKLPPNEFDSSEPSGVGNIGGGGGDGNNIGNHQIVEAQTENNMQEDIIEKPAAAAQTSQKSRKTSGPKQEDPYALDDSSIMLPVFIAIGAFIPLLFCLCKL